MNTFTFNGTVSTTYGIFIEHRPPHVTPKRVIESINIAGRSGNLLFDTGAYNNVTMTYQIAFIDNDVRGNAIDIATWLYQPDYCTLEDDYYPLYYRKAVYSSPFDLADVLGVAGRANITFDCMPQRFLKSGLTPITPQSGDTIANSYQPCLPVITIQGNGTLTVGNSVITISGNTGSLVIDSDRQNATISGANANDKISVSGGFPKIDNGGSTISWTGLTDVSVVPNYWTL